MNMNNLEQIRKTAHYLRSCVVSGIWGTQKSLEQGIPIAFDGAEPTQWITSDEVERRIAMVSQESSKRLMQIRLGLDDYRTWASRERQRAIDEAYDTTPAGARGPHYASPRPPRATTDRLSEEIARAILKTVDAAAVPRYDYVRELYSRSIVLPPGNVGTLTEVHRRIIRSNVDGLKRVVVHQSEHWNSEVTAGANGMGEVTVRTIRSRPDQHNGIQGERLDLEITFPPLNVGDDPRELTWLRTRTLESGWLPEDRSFVFASAPDRPTERIVIEIKFAADALPASVFRFDDVYEGDRLAEDIEMVVVPVRDGAVRCEWTNPSVGLASGIRVWW